MTFITIKRVRGFCKHGHGRLSMKKWVDGRYNGTNGKECERFKLKQTKVCDDDKANRRRRYEGWDSKGYV